MTSLRSGTTNGDQHAQAVRLMTEAMGRDVEEQCALIEARAEGRTDDVYWEGASQHVGRQYLHEEDRRLRDQIQCTMIQVHLAIERVRVEVARSRALVGRN